MPIFQSKKDYALPKVDSVPHIRAFVLQITTWSKPRKNRFRKVEHQTSRSAVILGITNFSLKHYAFSIAGTLLIILLMSHHGAGVTKILTVNSVTPPSCTGLHTAYCQKHRAVLSITLPLNHGLARPQPSSSDVSRTTVQLSKLVNISGIINLHYLAEYAFKML